MEITITGDYIQLDQLLKKEDLISSGGMTSAFLSMHKVVLNGVGVTEKRKKIRSGDSLSIDGTDYEIRSDQ
ncbi:MAG: RNA-binding S4 domain-containing protein [Dialister sp.]|nr:RNA-binding S4 domain-containing protein [Dialister sp.]